MNQHTARVLEFDRIVDTMLGFSLSRRGAAAERLRLLESCELITDTVVLERYREQSAWFETIIGSAAALPYEAWEDCTELFESLSRVGYVATVDELTEVLRFARAITGFLAFVRTSRDALPRSLSPEGIHSLLDALPPIPHLVSELNGYLDGTGGLREDQIPELRRARGRIHQSQSELRAFASSYVREHASMLSGDFATIRDGRTVLPLKTGFKGQVEGFVHHASASGETLFVEPWALVEKNNAVTQAEHEYLMEVQAILRKLTQVVANCRPAFEVLWEGADALDFFFARARHARAWGATFLGNSADVILRGARHPLLGKKAVPIDMVIPSDKRFVVLSGPNTGGKTVSLKTLGLAVLMRQSAMAVPVLPESSLPVFGSVYVDIGDEQSITHDLSTFSGHLARIKECLEAAKPDSLVLLDELGAGTDPEEGAALALAVGEAFLATGCLCMATSHYAAVKALAYAETRAMNASMDYNPQEARPTYRVLLGLPGSSHALDTAERVGLFPALVARARAIAGAKGDPAFDLVQRLTREHVELRDKLAEAERVSKVLARKELALADREAEVQRLTRNLEEAQLTAASGWLSESRSTVEALIRKLQEQDLHLQTLGYLAKDAAEKESARLAREARDSMKSLGDELSRKQEQKTEEILNSVPDLAPGTRVRYIDTKRDGIVLKAGRKGSYEVEFGGKRLHIRWDKLIPLGGPAPARKAEVSYTVEVRSPAQFSLDVRGMRMAEVIDMLQHQVDTALMQNLTYFSIIHGKGEGILQKGIHDYLAKAPGVERFEFARPEDGGFGKTLVFLRS